MWFAIGMSEHDVMVLDGHSSFATTHEFYLAVADDLIDRARVATAKGLYQKLVSFGTPAFGDQKRVDSRHRKSLYCNDLKLKRP